MKKVYLVLLLGLLLAPAGYSQTYVDSYSRSNGTYVQGYYRTNPDSSIYNNYSYQPSSTPTNIAPPSTSIPYPQPVDSSSNWSTIQPFLKY